MIRPQLPRPRRGNSERNSPSYHLPMGFSIITLALWQLRQTWRLLLVAGVGVLAAVVLICMIPLYSQLVISAGIRETLAASPASTYITVHSNVSRISPEVLQTVGNTVTEELRTNIGQYIQNTPGFSIDTRFALKPGVYIRLTGASMKQVSTHVKILQGRLPQSLSSAIEIAIPSQVASFLHLKVGAVLPVQLHFSPPGFDTGPANLSLPPIRLNLYVVGIFDPIAGSDSFWHGETFAPEPSGDGDSILFPMLVSNETFISSVARAASDPAYNDAMLQESSEAFWYYDFNESHFDVNHLDDLINRLNDALNAVAGNEVGSPYGAVDQPTANGPIVLLQLYRDRITLLQIPLQSLSFLIVGLALFFVSLMADLLVDSQLNALSILRSRGASRFQIFSSLLVQSAGLVLIALILGPLLAILLVALLARLTLSTAGQGAIGLITNNVVQMAWEQRWAALAAAGAAILAIMIAFSRTVQLNIQVTRHESARSTRLPLWQKLRLDIVALVIALTGFGFSLYITRPGVLDEHVRLLIWSPAILIGVTFLLLGCMLLLLRILPLFLNFAAGGAAHGRGATAMLALAQTARAPGRSVRMTMLLALAVAFTLFTLTFNASQLQRIPDEAAFQVASDFSGTFPTSAITRNLDQQVAAYQRIPGVTSVTIGLEQFETTYPPGSGGMMELLAVDARSYANTMIWTQQDSSQPSAPLMSKLVALRTSVLTSKLVPAIVDASTAQVLHLSIGTSFTLLANYHNPVNFITIAEVQHIPTISDISESNGTSDSTSQGGILVDYASYAAVYKATYSTDIGATNIWLRTQSDPRSLASVRAALSNGYLQLDGLNDRRAIIESLSHDPLYVALTGSLGIGVLLVLILALIGNLSTSWLQARSRLTNFALLRALGSTPRQIASLLALEQSIVYGMAIGLGIVFGFLLSFLVLPAYIFTNIVTAGIDQISISDFYAAQSVPPIQLVVPWIELLIALAVLAFLCSIGLLIMSRTISYPLTSQVLRLNED